MSWLNAAKDEFGHQQKRPRQIAEALKFYTKRVGFRTLQLPSAPYQAGLSRRRHGQQIR